MIIEPNLIFLSINQGGTLAEFLTPTQVALCPAVASSEHHNRLAALSPWIHLHLPGEFAHLHLPGVNTFILLDALFPPEHVASLAGTAQPVCIGWLRPELSRPTCYRYLTTLFDTCQMYLPCSCTCTCVFFFLQLRFSSSSSLRLWPTNNSGSSRRRSTLC